MANKRIDVAAVAQVIGTQYPPPYDQPCRARRRRKLGDAAGLTQFGVNLLTLPPGAWSSQRHWQTLSDEFVYVLFCGQRDSQITISVTHGWSAFWRGRPWLAGHWIGKTSLGAGWSRFWTG